MMRKFFQLLVFIRVNLHFYAATFTIGNNDVAGLISAITTANTNGQPDIINLAYNANYIFSNINFVMSGQSSGYTETDGGNALPYLLHENITGGTDIIFNLNGSTLQLANSSPKMRLIYSDNNVVWELKNGTIKNFESVLTNPENPTLNVGGAGGAINEIEIIELSGRLVKKYETKKVIRHIC